MPEQATTFNTWAIVEVMGHKRFAGFVTEQSFGVATLIRVDVPATDQPERRGYLPDGRYGDIAPRTTAAYSKLIGVASIYMVTPCTEDVARKVATVIEADNDPIPVAIPVERQIPASVGGSLDEFDASFDEHEDDDEPSPETV